METRKRQSKEAMKNGTSKKGNAEGQSKQRRSEVEELKGRRVKKRCDLTVSREDTSQDCEVGLFGRPGRIFFAEKNFEEAFCGQHINRQAAVP